jgi:hypothetical protein
LSYSVAKAWVDDMNRRFPEIKHWIAPAEQSA